MTTEITDDLYTRICAEAHRDATTFANEFPGQALDPATTDWDATAWSMAPADLRDAEGGFALYQSELVRQVALRRAAYCDRLVPRCYELHLIASTEPHDNPDATARLLGTYETEDDAYRAGQRYLREHPGAWVQTQPDDQSENGQDVRAT